MKLPIASLEVATVDEIVDCTIQFSVHSFSELQQVIASINQIKGVDEVHQVELADKR